METKKMTLAQAQEFVKNTKYIVCNEDESRRLQEKLFEIGLADDFLCIEIEQQKPKFNPSTLEAYDKVLVRNILSKEWLAYFFERLKEKHYITVGGLYWDFCIPYNDETKHLLGTENDAPEFYKLEARIYDHGN